MIPVSFAFRTTRAYSIRRFDRCEANGLVPFPDNPCREVDLHVAEPEHCIRAADNARASPHRGADACQEFAQTEWLRQVVVGSGVSASIWSVSSTRAALLK